MRESDKPRAARAIRNLLLAFAIVAGVIVFRIIFPAEPRDPDAAAIAGHALAGPTCPGPTTSGSPDPACAERPVAGAVIVARDLQGREVARTTTDAEGAFRLTLTAGDYEVSGEAVDGLMGLPQPVRVTGLADITLQEVDLHYDTGVR